MTFSPRQLTLTNFKSVDRSEIEFGPITVIVGANSSGKSSLIQSLLLLSQAARSGRTDARYPLNGELVHLGRFDELRNARFPERNSFTISLGGYLSANEHVRPETPYGTWTYEFVGTDRPAETRLHMLTFEAANRSETIASKVEFEFIIDDEARRQLAVVPGDEGPTFRYPASVMPVRGSVRSRAGIEDVHAVTMNGLTPNAILGQSTFGRLLASRFFKILYNDAFTETLRNPERIRGRGNFRATQEFDFSFSRMSRDELILAICKFLEESPGQSESAIARELEVDRTVVGNILVSREDLFEEDAPGEVARWNLIEGIYVPDISDFQSQSEMSDVDFQGFYEICRLAVADLAEFAFGNRVFRDVFYDGENANVLGDVDAWAASFYSVVDDLHSPGSSELESIADVLRNLSRFADWLSNDFIDEVEPVHGSAATTMLYPIDFGREFDISPNDALTAFLGREIRYLGPIREEPHRLDLYRQTDGSVGVRGEFTAAALHESSDLQVSYWTEPNVWAVEDLTTAVANWLQHLGLAEDFVTSDVGGHGIELRVRPSENSQPQLLTALGVGVSQALPVIVLGLLSQPGECVVIEQPELHLHPSMQAQLGEFFWSLAKSDRSVIIETHSEHILNSLRALIAESDLDESSMVQPVFAEQQDGVSAYRLPFIDEYGLLSEDWPSGFLNVFTDEARRIIEAAMQKRDRQAP